MLELENEVGPVPIIKKWPWPWPSAAAVGPHRSRSRSPDFDAQKSHPRNVAPPFFLSVLRRGPVCCSEAIFERNAYRSSERCCQGTSDAAANSMELASSLATARLAQKRCIAREPRSGVRRLSKTAVGQKRCSRPRTVRPERRSFLGPSTYAW